MLGLQYHLATLLAHGLIVMYSAPIFTSAILKNMKKMKRLNYGRDSTNEIEK